jgi:UTP-glucose-1-phosphate uridylyltransferase
MIDSDRTRVIIAAGGLGIRVHPWSRYLPKEFLPVRGRPGFVHLLEEIAQAGARRAVTVYHPYYEGFASWARHAFGPRAQMCYQRETGLPNLGKGLAERLAVTFIAQHGPYGDLTSLLNGADYYAQAAPTTTGDDEFLLAFADNLYPATNAMWAVRHAPPGVAVLARPYDRDLAPNRGVIVTTRRPNGRYMINLIEKPIPVAAQQLEHRYGCANLMMLEGRMRLNGHFIAFARTHSTPPGGEPKLALTLAAYAQNHSVNVVPLCGDVVDLGASAALSLPKEDLWPGGFPTKA